MGNIRPTLGGFAGFVGVALLSGATGGCSEAIGNRPLELHAIEVVAGELPAAPPAPVDAPPTCPPLGVEPFELAETNEDPPFRALAGGDGLAAFYRKVAALLRGRAHDHIRIAMYGDSNLIEDFQTGQMRRRLQARFGDAGHGFVAVAQPWWAYRHMDVRAGSPHWTAYAVSTTPSYDGLYGLAGIAAENVGVGGSAFAQTALAGAPVGERVDAFEIFYLNRPTARFGLLLDGKRFDGGETTTDGPLAVRRVVVPDGPHRLDIVPDTRVRVFGVTLERAAAAPSFVVDSFGVGALNTRAQAAKIRCSKPAMLRRRHYDLVVFHTGHNDGYAAAATLQAMASIVALHRETLPEAPILMLTPADRGERDTPYFTRLAIEQRRTMAEEHGLALWDLYEAMGGPRSMASFVTRGLARRDYVHFSPKGGAWVGDRLLVALWRDFARYLGAHPDCGCESSMASAAR